MSVFSIRADSSFEWPVRVKEPVNGEYIDHEFEATFNIMSQGEVNELYNDGPISTGSLRVLRETLVEVRGIDVKEANGDPAASKERAIEIILGVPWIVRGLSDAFASGNSGHEVKN